MEGAGASNHPATHRAGVESGRRRRRPIDHDRQANLLALAHRRAKRDGMGARTTNSSSVSTAWMIAFPASDAVTTYLPNALNDAVLTGPLYPLSSTISAPVWASQTCAVLSFDAVTTSLPSAPNGAVLTGPL